MINIDDIPIETNGVKLNGRDLTPEAQEMLRHLVDLDSQKHDLLFKLRQVEVTEAAFKAAFEQRIHEDLGAAEEAANG